MSPSLALFMVGPFVLGLAAFFAAQAVRARVAPNSEPFRLIDTRVTPARAIPLLVAIAVVLVFVVGR